MHNGPTSAQWIDPWVQHLRSRGVNFVVGQALSGLTVNGKHLASATVTDPASSQAQFWKRRFTDYGDHTVRDCLSAIISDCTGKLQPQERQTVHPTRGCERSLGADQSTPQRQRDGAH